MQSPNAPSSLDITSSNKNCIDDQLSVESNAPTDVTMDVRAISLDAYREAKVEKAALKRRAAKTESMRRYRTAMKENPKLHKAVKKTDRRRKRTARKTLSKIGLKETPKSERVSRKVSKMQQEINMKNAELTAHIAGKNYIMMQKRMLLQQNEACLREDARK